MTSRVDQRLGELGLTLPPPSKAAGSYVPYRRTGPWVHISGQVPVGPSGLEFVGKLGRDFDVADGQKAARLCALNILAQLRTACDGDLDRVRACLKITGFVNAVPDFTDHPAVINGASELIVDVLGEPGRHARAAVGAGSLPLGVAVEVDAMFEIA